VIIIQSLAVKYRPQDWLDVCGQVSVVKILEKQLLDNKIKNCYLFCGASGCGKTTLARIFANKINNGIGTPIEIDGASNNGVDNVKSIIKEAQTRAIDGKYKVYIIDECHSISPQGWNAFLKCIEEPPEYTIFIFCTTDPQKIPNTIINRVQRFNFSRIDVNQVKDRLLYICKNENFTNFEDCCDYIAKTNDGKMRDSISTLEKCASYSTDLSMSNVLQALGVYSYDYFFKLINNVIDGKEDNVLTILNEIYFSGDDIKVFIDQYFSFCLDILKFNILKSFDIIKIPKSYEKDILNSINFDNSSKYYGYIVDKLLQLKNMIKNDSDPKTTVDTIFLQMTRCV
jgi:DNA polymerase-3 subunit gamma/tau